MSIKPKKCIFPSKNSIVTYAIYTFLVLLPRLLVDIHRAGLSTEMYFARAKVDTSREFVLFFFFPTTSTRIKKWILKPHTTSTYSALRWRLFLLFFVGFRNSPLISRTVTREIRAIMTPYKKSIHFLCKKINLLLHKQIIICLCNLLSKRLRLIRGISNQGG